MLKLTRQEAEKLRLTLNWVLDATLGTQKDKILIETIRDKISNIIKTRKRDQDVPISLVENDEIN